MTMRARAPLRQVGEACAIALLAACGGGGGEGTGLETPHPDRVTLSDSVVTLQAGFTHSIAAALRTADGQPIAGATFAWSSTNDAVVTVTQGLIEARGVGTAMVSASASGKSASVAVTVVPTVVVAVQLSRTRAVLAPGRTLSLVAVALDSRGQAIAGRTASFTSTRPDVAIVSSDGMLTTIGVGDAVIRAVVGEHQDTLLLLVGQPQQLAIPTAAAVPEPVPGAPAYRLTLRHADDSLTVQGSIGPWGALTGTMVLAPQMEYVATASGALAMPARMTAPSSSLPASVPVVFVPSQLTLDTGPAAGNYFVSVVAALAPCNAPTSQCSSGFYPTTFSTGVQRWERYPVVVAVDPAVDSTAVWNALASLEQAVGQKLFVRPDGTLPIGIDVRVGTPPGMGAFGGYAMWYWDVRDNIMSATVWFRNSTPSTYLVHHEFTHALGFGHTCAWPSVMGGYGCTASTAVTGDDVAYITLASRLHEAERQFRLPSSGKLPCGTMSLWAARPQGVSVTCFEQGPDWLGDGREPKMARVTDGSVRKAEMP